MLATYCTDNELLLFLGLFLIGIALFGLYILLTVKRPSVFKLKVAFIYSIPLFLGVSLILRNFSIENDFQVLLLCTFITLQHMLYWREVSKLTTDVGYHKRMLVDFLDIVPDMVWMKDIDNRFTYTNPAIRDKLLLCTEEEAYGKTGTELAEVQREKGHSYTFGEVCSDSDEITKSRGEECRFLEFGDVNGKFIALQVFKAPLYSTAPNGTKRLIGTIGMGRDLTYEYLDHEHIIQLFDDKEYEKAEELFRRHMTRYLFTGTKVSGTRGRRRTDNEIVQRGSGDDNS